MTGTLRVILLWHMHQPFYKNLVTGEYRMPWVRLHASKDYYGMVKLLDEFPDVHQNFNLVPSLLDQIQDYATGNFREPFYEVASKPAEALSQEERRFALQYLFHAHVGRHINRYPRYAELYERFRSAGEDPVRAETNFSTRDYADLQVLSQIAWMDEYWLAQPELAALVTKGEGFTREDQKLVLAKQRDVIAAVMPAYKAAADRGSIEISATPYYHPILPLVCDTDIGAVSVPGLSLPNHRYREPEDADDQIRRALDAHERVFGRRPVGMWPSEGSVSEEVLGLGAKNGLRWMATDEGVLGRTVGYHFERDGNGCLPADAAKRLYNIYRYEKGDTEMHMVFRDHRISDLIGFVYAGMPARDAASHLIHTLKQGAEPITKHGGDAVVSIILDGENAWETYEESGRDFLRFFYEGLQRDRAIEPVTISEAIERHKPQQFGTLKSLVPGSWINANFNVWIGAPEDNRAWDYLAAAREFYEMHSGKASPEQRDLAYQELLIAEGSDWNWWYGPEHHSANDRDFDELYRAHLSNVYTALGGEPPEYLMQAIAVFGMRPTVMPQTAFIRPHIDGRVSSYFDWLGAALYSADRRTSSMHGKQFLLDAVYAGIDEERIYGRVDFAAELDQGAYEMRVHFDRVEDGGKRRFRLDCFVEERTVREWRFFEERDEREIDLATSGANARGVEAALGRIFEFGVPLHIVGARLGDIIELRFSLWREHLPLDALPLEGSVEVQVEKEDVLATNQYAGTK